MTQRVQRHALREISYVGDLSKRFGGSVEFERASVLVREDEPLAEILSRFCRKFFGGLLCLHATKDRNGILVERNRTALCPILGP